MQRGDDVKAEVLSALQRLAVESRTDTDGEETAEFLRNYYEGSAPADLADVDPLDLCGAALAHRKLANRREPGEAVVRVVAPRFDLHGWSSKHAAVQVVIDDMPFVVDSVRTAITRRGLGIHVLHHPIIDGVSMVHVDVDRHAGAIAEELTADLIDALRYVRAVVDDWRLMFDDLAASITRLERDAAGHVPDDELNEAVEFLRWLADDNFTFIGVRHYELTDEGGEAAVCRVVGTGLGILRGDDEEPAKSKLSPHGKAARARTCAAHPDQGQRHVHGAPAERASTTSASGSSMRTAVWSANAATSGCSPPACTPRARTRSPSSAGRSSWSGRCRASLLPATPTRTCSPSSRPTRAYELVQVGPVQLHETALAIHQLQERRLTRVFVRQDDYERFWSVLVYLPRDRYNTTIRLAVERLLVEGLHGESATYQVRVSESTLARLHYVIQGGADSEVDHDALEARIVAAVRELERRAPRPVGGGARRGRRHRALAALGRGVLPRIPRRASGARGRGRHRAPRGPRTGRHRLPPVPAPGGSGR